MIIGYQIFKRVKNKNTYSYINNLLESTHIEYIEQHYMIGNWYKYSNENKHDFYIYKYFNESLLSWNTIKNYYTNEIIAEVKMKYPIKEYKGILKNFKKLQNGKMTKELILPEMTFITSNYMKIEKIIYKSDFV